MSHRDLNGVRKKQPQGDVKQSHNVQLPLRHLFPRNYLQTTRTVCNPGFIEPGKPWKTRKNLKGRSEVVEKQNVGDWGPNSANRSFTRSETEQSQKRFVASSTSVDWRKARQNMEVSNYASRKPRGGRDCLKYLQSSRHRMRPNHRAEVACGNWELWRHLIEPPLSYSHTRSGSQPWHGWIAKHEILRHDNLWSVRTGQELCVSRYEPTPLLRPGPCSGRRRMVLPPKGSTSRGKKVN